MDKTSTAYNTISRDDRKTLIKTIFHLNDDELKPKYYNDLIVYNINVEELTKKILGKLSEQWVDLDKETVISIINGTLYILPISDRQTIVRLM